MAATILRARRPPWSAPKHADHSRAGPQKRGRIGACAFYGSPALPRSWPERRSPGAWTAALLHRCSAARLLQPPQAIKTPWLTPLLANRLAKASNERARIETRLEIGAIVAKLVKNLRIYHNLCFHLLHLVARRLCKRSKLITLQPCTSWPSGPLRHADPAAFRA
jgi:hypothetical protein